MFIKVPLGNVSRDTWISNTPCYDPEIAPRFSDLCFFLLLFSDQSQALHDTTASTVLLAKSTLAL